jgi:hypothetical protein
MTTYGDGTRWCHNCGVEITWAPVRAWSRYYCCKQCLRDEPCDCPPPMEDEEQELTGERRSDVERVE